MLTNQPPQALQSLLGGGMSSPAMGGQSASLGTNAGAEAKTKGKSYWGFDGPLRTHFQDLDKDGQKEFLKSFQIWNDKAWWDGSMWVDPNHKSDPDAKTDDVDVDTTWIDDVQNVRDKGPTGLSAEMKKNIGFGAVTPGMLKSTGLVSSGMTKYMGDPVVKKPNPHPGRPDETGMRPFTPTAKPVQGQAVQGTGMSEMLAKLIGG